MPGPPMIPQRRRGPRQRHEPAPSRTTAELREVHDARERVRADQPAEGCSHTRVKGKVRVPPAEHHPRVARLGASAPAFSRGLIKPLEAYVLPEPEVPTIASRSSNAVAGRTPPHLHRCSTLSTLVPCRCTASTRLGERTHVVEPRDPRRGVRHCAPGAGYHIRISEVLKTFARAHTRAGKIPNAPPRPLRTTQVRTADPIAKRH